MALDVEDGTGKATSDAYCSTTFADTWHSGRGITLWATLQTEEKEQAIRRATDYMMQVYRYRWAGTRVTTTQALDWPRSWVPQRDTVGFSYGGMPYYAETVVPVEVQRACAELAFKAASGDLAPDVERLVKRVKIAAIEQEYESGAAPWTRFRSIDNMLAGLFKAEANGMSISLVRA